MIGFLYEPFRKFRLVLNVKSFMKNYSLPFNSSEILMSALHSFRIALTSSVASRSGEFFDYLPNSVFLKNNNQALLTCSWLQMWNVWFVSSSTNQLSNCTKANIHVWAQFVWCAQLTFENLSKIKECHMHNLWGCIKSSLHI